MKLLLQRRLPFSGRAVVKQLADLDAALAGGQVHGLGKQIPGPAVAEQQRVGEPEALPPRQLGIGRSAQGGQRFGAFRRGHRPHGDGIDFLFARQFAQQPSGRHVQGAVELIHRSSFVYKRSRARVFSSSL